MFEPALFFWRLIPVGIVTSIVGVLTFLIAFDARESGFNSVSIALILIYGLPLALILALVLAVPMSLIWVLIYASSVNINPRVRHRATIASRAFAAIGALLVICIFASASGSPGMIVLILAPAALLPIFLAVVLTSLAFAKSEAQN